MPEIFQMINNAFRRGTTPVKGKLFGSRNRALIPSSTGSGNPNWIIKRITPTTISQSQRGSVTPSIFQYLFVLKVELSVCFLYPIRIL